jgi:3-oxoacyl-[acyl-carrier protein] reductase
MTNDLQDRVAVVTGSSRGIGAAIALRFATEGAHVAVNGRDAAAIDAVCEEIEAIGGVALAVAADVTHFDDIEAMRVRIEETLGTVDIVVANAGGSPVRPGLVEDLSEDDWHASVDANLTSTFLTIKSFLPGMKQRGRGNIITLSSAAARRPNPRSPIAYASAKAGIELLTQDVAAQAGPFGVRVNCIAPETILTETNSAQIPPEMQTTLAAEHPLRRLGSPDDVAQAAVFLASDASAWITGVILDVAGGAVLA